jgi:hypothetical protein
MLISKGFYGCFPERDRRSASASCHTKSFISYPHNPNIQQILTIFWL